MTKPQEYQEQRTILCDTHYQVDERFPKGPQSGSGVLTTGRIVWIANASELPKGEETVHAFAEGIGVVSVAAESVNP